MFGDWNLALAGYNWGEGRVSRWVDRTGAQDFWSLAEQASMPRETRNYVPMIHAAILVAKAPEKYGFEVTPEQELSYESVPVQGAVDLRVIAECASTGLDSMQMLNPELRRLATPANRTFDVKVPQGRGASVRVCLDKLPADKRVTFRTHTVARGQTLASVARQYGTKVSDIAVRQRDRRQPDQASGQGHGADHPDPARLRAPAAARARQPRRDGGHHPRARAHPVQGEAGRHADRDRGPLSHDRPRADVLEQAQRLAARGGQPAHRLHASVAQASLPRRPPRTGPRSPPGP